MKPIRIVASLVALLPLAACAPQAQEGAEPIAGADAQMAGQALSASVEDGARFYGGPDLSASAAATCHTVTGDLTDTDGDGIPVSVSITYDCNETSGSNSASFVGTEAFADDDTAAASFDFSATSDVVLSLSGTNGSISFARDAALAASQSGSSYSLDVSSSNTVDAVGPNGGTYSANETIGWLTSYAPSTTWTPGQPPVAGTYSVDGAWSVVLTHGGNSHAAEAAVSTDVPLQLDPACETGIVGGKISAAYAGENGTSAIEVTWTGCGQKTVAYVDNVT